MWHFWRGACSVWRGVAFLEGHDILEEVLAVFWRGCGIFGEVLAMFWRDVAFWRCLQCFGGVWHFGGVLAVFWRVWHFGGTCSVLEGCGILEGCFEGMWHFWRALEEEFWRGVAVLEGTCSVLEGVAFLEGTCSVLDGVAFLEGCLQCLGRA